MNTIHKYTLEITDEQFVTLPQWSKILTVQVYGGKLCLWAVVDKEEKRTQDRCIRIIGTGNPVVDASQLKYIGIVQMSGGVWHVFEKEQS